jgi:hypothetical protein
MSGSPYTPATHEAIIQTVRADSYAARAAKLVGVHPLSAARPAVARALTALPAPRARRTLARERVAR